MGVLSELGPPIGSGLLSGLGPLGLPVWAGSLHFGLDMLSGLGTSRLGGGPPVWAWASLIGWGLQSGLGPPTWAWASIWAERPPIWAGAPYQDGGLLSRLRASRLDWGT